MIFKSLLTKAKNNQTLRDCYFTVCLTFQMLFGCFLLNRYGCDTIGSTGPSMIPTLDPHNNLLFVDLFTLRFLRKPKRGEVIMV